MKMEGWLPSGNEPVPVPSGRKRLHSGLGLNFIQPQARVTGARLLKSLRRFPGAIGLAEMILSRAGQARPWSKSLGPGEARTQDEDGGLAALHTSGRVSLQVTK